ncbi:MAG: fasciclin domain-containing protein [Bacteroidota bacterium]
MKYTWLIILLNFVVVTAFAQKTDSGAVKLLIPKGIKTKVVNGVAMANNQNIIQNVAKAKDYTTLLSAIKTAGLTETFESKGPITIFAPTNSAFAKLPAGKLDSLLLPSHKFELSSVLTYHAIQGKVSAKDIARNIREHKGTATYVTLAGSKIAATIDTNRNIILTDETGGQCIISQFDVEQSNGMLHVVNSVFIPKTRVI